MNRIATTLNILAASALLSQTLGAAEPSLSAIDSRLKTLESRLTSIEAAVKGNSGAYNYTQEATLEATKGGQGTAASTATATGQTYVIQDGDTLGKIVDKFKVERKALLEANRLSEGQPIYIGETLIIPGVAPAPSTGVATVADAGTPAPVKKESIVVGETKKPVAPAPAPANTTLHKVAKGDTLTGVAKKYKTSVESLKAANGLRSDSISLGQTLKIPSAQSVAKNTTTPAAPAPKPEQASAFQYDNELLLSGETYGYYSVAKGDNLYALARDFFTTMSELQRVNRLGSSTTIFPGNEIIVPTSKYNAYHKTGEVAKR